MSAPRTLPVRVQPQPAEALDSWLERLAHRNSVPVQQFLPALGLPIRNVPGWRPLVTAVPATVLRRIERQTGVAAGQLDHAVIGPRTPPQWQPIIGSRYCPACLADSGAWSMRWRLPWTFACHRHHALLPDRCPACGQVPRRRVTAAAGLHPPTICTTLRPEGPCLHDLTTSAYWHLDPDEPRLHAQQWINERLDRFQAGTRTADIVDDLADLAAVSVEIRRRATDADFTGYGRPTLVAFTEYVRCRNNSHRPARQVFTDPLIVAAVAVTAVGLLSARRHTDIVTRLRPLLGHDGHDGRGHRRSMPANPSLLATLSPDRQARLLTAIGPSLAPLERLRLRTCGTAPRMPTQHDVAARRVAHLPQLLWPPWAVRLTPPDGQPSDTIREAIPCCLLIVGAPNPARHTVLAGLRSRWPAQAHLIFARLPEPTRTAVLTAICRIAEHLDQHGSPINYQQRRQRIGTELLTTRQWQQFCYNAMAHPGIGRRHLDARRYLYQLLTGADLGEPHRDLTFRDPADRSSYLTFTDQLTTPLRAALHDHAHGWLRRLGIDEPLIWAPPASCADGLNLPGRDPDDIDLAAVEHLILTDKQPVGVVANQLATSIEHIRYTLHTAIDRPPRTWGPNAAPMARHTRQRAHATLTRRFFNREYVNRGKRLDQLRDETGFHNKILSDYAHRAGIPLATAREPHHIDEHWLRNQYLHHHRSFTAIAADLGISDMTVTRAARTYGITARQPGITSHPHLITPIDDDIPLDVRRAVEGQLHGWLRLRRFEQAMSHPSLNQAARHLGTHTSALVTQIQRLERDIGAPLTHHTTPTSPATPTDRGAALLRDLQQPRLQELMNKHGKPVRGWKPDDPRRTTTHAAEPPPAAPQLPDGISGDLRRAVNGHRNGWARLQRFAAAMTYPTLTEAAHAIGINIATLVEQLQRLERDVGATLFHRATPASQIQRPTRRGTALLRAFTRPDIQTLCPDPVIPAPANRVAATPEGLPGDLLRAVQGQQSGWTRLERFATTMTHPTIGEAAEAIGINRTTLIEQLHRLETDLGEPLYHRATADGEPQHPTDRGVALLRILARPDIQALHTHRTRLPRTQA